MHKNKHISKDWIPVYKSWACDRRLYRAFSLSVTKESVYIREEFNSNRIGLEHQHGRRCILLGHQYGRRGVMRKRCTWRNRAFSLTWPASMQIYWDKRKHLHKKRVQLPKDFFGTPTWPPFHCFGHQYGRLDVMWKRSITKARNRLLIKQSTLALLLLAVKITLALIWLCFCNGDFKGQIKLPSSPDPRS